MELLSMNYRENPNKSELLSLPRRKLKGNVRTNYNIYKVDTKRNCRKREKKKPSSHTELKWLHPSGTHPAPLKPMQGYSAWAAEVHFKNKSNPVITESQLSFFAGFSRQGVEHMKAREPGGSSHHTDINTKLNRKPVSYSRVQCQKKAKNTGSAAFQLGITSCRGS